MGTLTIGHGNGHNENSLVEFVKDAKANSFSCLESQALIEKLENIPNTRRVGPDKKEGWVEERNRALSTCIITENSLPNIGSVVRQVSDKIERYERVAPDRVLVGSFFEHPVAKALKLEGVAHWALHPDAGPKALNGDNPDHSIVREYWESMETTFLHMELAEKDGLLNVLTGDLQVGARHDKPWGPRKVLANPLRLNCRVSGIDWIMIDRRLTYAGALQTRKLFDHTGFVATLKAKS